ncbi:MAG TPA: flagellar basal body P-ring protein FlgI [Armatimonadota bacterium]|mgnify:CR=1 FL=1|jgi:flagellar P-ring protein precursor FlgI|nr:flagellar basal body P-ring protein FlgI [Armatimonadota bacterium]
MQLKKQLSILCLTIIILSIAATTVTAGNVARIKDIARIEGARNNQLVGYGLVVGLDGTGDTQQAIFTTQSVANMLKRLGIDVPDGKLKVKNVAAVMVTAELPPFVRPGAEIDVIVSSLGDARSLQGGTLLQTPLQAANGGIYAVAQGSVSVGGFTAGGGGTSVTKNHTTVGRIPGGAIVEQSVPATLSSSGAINVLLNNPDFTTAVRVARAIEAKLGPGTASALDAATIQIMDNGTQSIPVLIADISELPVEQSTVAKVIVNERTGTVVIGSQVQVSPVAISHGNLTIEVSTDYQVSQPSPISETGDTVIVPDKAVTAEEERPHLIHMDPGVTLDELVRALNELKVTPRDMVAILQALKQAGALHAELEII